MIYVVLALLFLAAVALAVWGLLSSAEYALLRRLGAKRLHFEDAPHLQEVVAQLSVAARLPRPPLYVIPRGGPHVFAVGLGRRRSSLLITRAALERLRPLEQDALVAHAVAHLVGGDAPRTTAGAWLRIALRRLGPIARSPRQRARLQGWSRRVVPSMDLEVETDRIAAQLLGDTSALLMLLKELQSQSPQDPALKARIEALEKLPPSAYQPANRPSHWAVLRRSPSA